MKSGTLSLSVAALVVGSATLAHAAAVTVPYSNDFSSSAAEFATSASGTWNLTGGNYVNTITAANNFSVAAFQVTNLTGGFTMQTVAKITSTVAQSTFGLGALGEAASLTGNTGSGYYLADVQSSTGFMRIGSFSGGTFTQLVAGNFTGVTAPLATNTPYTFTLTGNYTGSDLVLTLTMTDGTTTKSINTAAITSPIAGQYFGYRDRENGTAGTFTVAYDSLTLTAVPEPASLGLLTLAGAALIRRRS